ncbi:hypothetical protein CDAR_180581 [Caerostris darwini]|uniref:Uncharacterized protein n=1 Tax=Caerostris darwini TaxID=1538125 RepID=A0AAV4UGM4_9ARAC|nr:hypothetical protein CDAR_180581 [Caerostris darwini]
MTSNFPTHKELHEMSSKHHILGQTLYFLIVCPSLHPRQFEQCRFLSPYLWVQIANGNPVWAHHELIFGTVPACFAGGDSCLLTLPLHIHTHTTSL